MWMSSFLCLVMDVLPFLWCAVASLSFLVSGSGSKSSLVALGGFFDAPS